MSLAFLSALPSHFPNHSFPFYSFFHQTYSLTHKKHFPYLHFPRTNFDLQKMITRGDLNNTVLKWLFYVMRDRDRDPFLSLTHPTHNTPLGVVFFFKHLLILMRNLNEIKTCQKPFTISENQPFFPLPSFSFIHSVAHFNHRIFTGRYLLHWGQVF